MPKLLLTGSCNALALGVCWEPLVDHCDGHWQAWQAMARGCRVRKCMPWVVLHDCKACLRDESLARVFQQVGVTS